MAGLFDLLNTVIGKITQNNVTYATAPTPPDGDNSTKVATTAFVADKTAAIPSGNVAVWSRDFSHTLSNQNMTLNVYAPTGGTWFCWGQYSISPYNGDTCYINIYGKSVSGGGLVGSNYLGSVINPSTANNNMMALKIA